MARPALADNPTPTVVDSTRGGGLSVGFTFDDGPNPPDTLRLLDVLREHHVKAVFCLWGDHVRQHPEVVRRIVADGHTLCNHGMRHDDMATWSAERIRADLVETSAAIRAAAPGARIPYFRAPYGSWGRTPAVAAALGMQALGWRLAIGDWEPPGTTELIRRLREGITGRGGPDARRRRGPESDSRRRRHGHPRAPVRGMAPVTARPAGLT